MSRRIQVEGHANLVRDANSGAIINTSTSEYITYMNIQRKKSEEKSKMMSKKYVKTNIGEVIWQLHKY